jgi:hypothetical protein
MYQVVLYCTPNGKIGCFCYGPLVFLDYRHVDFVKEPPVNIALLSGLLTCMKQACRVFQNRLEGVGFLCENRVLDSSPDL